MPPLPHSVSIKCSKRSNLSSANLFAINFMYWYSLRTKLGSKEALDSELLGIKDAVRSECEHFIAHPNNITIIIVIHHINLIKRNVDGFRIEHKNEKKNHEK